MATHLRVFDDSCAAKLETQDPTVEVTLGDLLPLLALAQRRNYVWLRDFLEDRILITPDLYEVLRAFQRRPA